MTDTLTVDIGTMTVRYRVWGPPEAPVVVLLHGLTSDGRSWSTVAEALADRWRVYAPDARGHGGSDWPGEYSFPLLHQDLRGFCEALALRRPVLVGHSMGGVAAYLYAQHLPAEPAGLVLAETPPPVPIRRPLPPRPDTPPRYDWTARVAVVGQLAEPDPRWDDGFGDIAAPTLVIGGGPDSPFSQPAMSAIAERIPAGRFVTLPVGHRLHAVDPEGFLALLTPFLAELG